MIGLIAKSEDHEAAREFFELFKSPWEWYRSEGRYDVVLCVSEELLLASNVMANLIILYAGHEQQMDREGEIEVRAHRKVGTLLYKEERFPIYNDILTFLSDEKDVLKEEQSGESAIVRRKAGPKHVVRIGYDLFHEIRNLLSDGQPHEYADIATVEIHIGILRDLIVDTGIPLIEILPTPEGYSFIACLTHDVDHPSIRLHRWDHTVWGFVYRAIIQSSWDVLRSRVPFEHFLTNWVAAAKLPFIYLGLARDFWLDFGRYLRIEGGGSSTFFVLPVKGKPGLTETGSAPHIRASGYSAADIADQIRTVMKEGGEVGLHGIDAWVDGASGDIEKSQIEQVTGAKLAGVRMHWLYFNGESPALLEKAGFMYDSTVGYNETVGYRAGTTQVYKPISVTHLLELPMHVMDTALFHPACLGLSLNEATQRIDDLINNVRQFGGVITLNWHDRSIAPERLWGRLYSQLVNKVRHQGAWLASAHQAVSWFRKRRNVVFEAVGTTPRMLRASVCGAYDPDVPGMRLRVYNSSRGSGARPFIDIPFGSTAEIAL